MKGIQALRDAAFKHSMEATAKLADLEADARLIAAEPEMLKALRYYAAIKGPLGEPARAALSVLDGDSQL